MSALSLSRPATWRPSPQTLTLAALAAGILVGLLATSHDETVRAVAASGTDLTRLLRAMTAIKAVMVLAASWAVLWRLADAAPWPRLAGYALSCAAMAAGPGLIWGMAHVAAGALLLHGGLLAAVLLLWRDPVTSRRLAHVVAARRRQLRAGS